jgi:hypothetical protein
VKGSNSVKNAEQNSNWNALPAKLRFLWGKIFAVRAGISYLAHQILPPKTSPLMKKSKKSNAIFTRV